MNLLCIMKNKCLMTGSWYRCMSSCPILALTPIFTRYIWMLTNCALWNPIWDLSCFNYPVCLWSCPAQSQSLFDVFLTSSAASGYRFYFVVIAKNPNPDPLFTFFPVRHTIKCLLFIWWFHPLLELTGYSIVLFWHLHSRNSSSSHCRERTQRHC